MIRSHMALIHWDICCAPLGFRTPIGPLQVYLSAQMHILNAGTPGLAKHCFWDGTIAAGDNDNSERPSRWQQGASSTNKLWLTGCITSLLALAESILTLPFLFVFRWEKKKKGLSRRVRNWEVPEISWMRNKRRFFTKNCAFFPRLKKRKKRNRSLS
ncbi:hypothetical protein F5X99DRAFT_278414 [Biscogniauxia marginata]|nr:hypothetical protein F5X99DRAFT_278414 [Biscogniauxia marginata]